jgi:hypothetical protein
VGLADGNIVCRSCISLNSIFVIDSTVLSTQTIWSIVSLGKSCFGTAGEDGHIVVWKIDKALQEPVGK